MSKGQTILVEGRWYGEHIERPLLAVELVQAKVDVIVAGAPQHRKLLHAPRQRSLS